MTESEKILAFERKYKQLLEEENLILKLLKDVRKQIEKYEVEELQTCSHSQADKSDEEESESDESVCGDKELLLKVLDSADLVNKASLNLDLSKVFEEESNEDEEESEISE